MTVEQPPSVDEVVELAATLVVADMRRARHPDAVLVRLERGHTPDATGHCRGHANTARWWPCHGILVARRARQLWRARRA